MRASTHRQPRLPAQQPQPRQRLTPALRRPGGADIANKAQRKAGGCSMAMQLPGVSPAAPDPAFEQSSKSSMLPCQFKSGALETLPQKPVFARHKRPGAQIAAKRPPASKASKASKVGSLAYHRACS